MKNFKLNLTTFGEVTNKTTDSALSAEMKTFYEMALIDLAEPELVYDQFAAKRPIPPNGGKTIEFRSYEALPKATSPLSEGVKPDGQPLETKYITATVSQYGDFIKLTDMLQMTAIDNNVVESTKLLSSQAGRTLDTVVRDAVVAGLNVNYASKVSGDTVTAVDNRKDLDGTAKITIDDIERIVAKLRSVNAPKINGKYVAIAHPNVIYDIRRNKDFVESHKYAQPENLFNGEVGELAGVRFIESSEAKIFRDGGLTSGSRSLTVKSTVSSSTTVPVKEKITADDVSAFAARAADDKYIYINGTKTAVSALVAGEAGSASLTLASAGSVSADTKLYDYLASTKTDNPVYATMFFGDGAYASTEITGGGLEMFVNQLGYGDDPLHQNSSVGWKATKVAEILIPEYLIRFESCSGIGDYVTAN